MTNKERLEIAYKLLLEVSENWSEKEVKTYKAKMSFDELVAEIGSIKLKSL
jgi:hypothetical protein